MGKTELLANQALQIGVIGLKLFDSALQIAVFCLYMFTLGLQLGPCMPQNQQITQPVRRYHTV